MIDGKWLAPGSDLATVSDIRDTVFGVREDALDNESWNVIVRFDEQPVGTGRIRWEDGAFWLDWIGVLPAWRGKRWEILFCVCCSSKRKLMQRARFVLSVTGHSRASFPGSASARCPVRESAS